MTDQPTTIKVRLVDPNGGRFVPRLGINVAVNQEVEVSEEQAKRMLASPGVWQPVGKAAKDLIKDLASEPEEA